MEKNLRFSMTIKDVEKINPLFSKCKAYILYKDDNRNGSYLSKEAVEDAIPSLYNIPIVGEYLKEKDNFGSHGGKLEIKDDEIEYVQTTVPYGLIPESANVYWEEVQEKNGSVNEYLVADGCILWTGRYQELSTVMEEGKYNQSMEIQPVDANFAIVGGKEVFKIDKFIFSALCILGVDKGDNPNDHVEPCFESASIIAYSLDEFKLQFNQMIDEFKYIMQKGGQLVSEKKVAEEKVNEETPVVEEKVVEEKQEPEVVEPEVTEENKETPTEKNPAEKVIEETPAEVTEEEDTEKFELTQKLKDATDALEQANAKFEALEQEVVSLRKFKRDTEVQSVVEKFSGKLKEETITSIIEKNSETNISELEDLLFAEIGKQNFSLAQEEKQTKQTEIQIPVNTEIKDEMYDGLFSKFLEK